LPSAATVKLALLLRCRADGELVQAFLKVARPITRLIVVGMVLLALSGIGWLLVAHDLTPLLIVNAADIDFVNNREQYEDLLREMFRPSRAAVEYYNPPAQR